MSYIEMLCQHFGVEENETFQVEGRSYEYKIKYPGLQYKFPNESEGSWKNSQNELEIAWDRKVIRKPWRPKYDEVYFYKCFDKDNICSVYWYTWTDDSDDYMRLTIGNCFKTYEEAKAFDLKAKLKEMGVKVNG